jgi:hypothetical protein
MGETPSYLVQWEVLYCIFGGLCFLFFVLSFIQIHVVGCIRHLKRNGWSINRLFLALFPTVFAAFGIGGVLYGLLVIPSFAEDTRDRMGLVLLEFPPFILSCVWIVVLFFWYKVVRINRDMFEPSIFMLDPDARTRKRIVSVVFMMFVLLAGLLSIAFFDIQYLPLVELSVSSLACIRDVVLLIVFVSLMRPAARIIFDQFQFPAIHNRPVFLKIAVVSFLGIFFSLVYSVTMLVLVAFHHGNVFDVTHLVVAYVMNVGCKFVVCAVAWFCFTFDIVWRTTFGTFGSGDDEKQSLFGEMSVQ